MKVTYCGLLDRAAVIAWLSDLRPRSVIFDVEPLVAGWNTDDDCLRRGLDDVLDQLQVVPGIDVVGFATNSARRVALEARPGGPEVFYRATACKPFVTAPYRDLPRPAALVGDQIATDGLLAWRLGFAFGHLLPGADGAPLGPRAMRLVGMPLAPLIFARGH